MMELSVIGEHNNVEDKSKVLQQLTTEPDNAEKFKKPNILEASPNPVQIPTYPVPYTNTNQYPFQNANVQYGNQQSYTQAGPFPASWYGQNPQNVEANDDPFPAFLLANIQIRNRFIQRVYTILCIQLLMTFGFVLMSIYSSDVAEFLVIHKWISYVALGVFMVLYIIMVCCNFLTRIVPLNFILLFLLTGAMSIICAYASLIYNPEIVLMSIGLTAVICIIISICAIQSKFDMTGCGMFLYVISMVVLLFGVTAMIVSMFIYVPILRMIYSVLIALLFCAYLFYDTQLICGGRKHELSPEEYISGALHLYIDIIYIFLSLLEILGCATDN